MDGRPKPDLVGVDRVQTAAVGRFRGTSQAAPHVAGLAALVLQRRPNLSPVKLAALLKSEARPRGMQPNNTWGYGLAFLTRGAGQGTNSPKDGARLVKPDPTGEGVTSPR